MVRFLVKIFITFVLIYSILYLIQNIVDSILDTNNVCDNSWYKIFNGKIDSEIVVLGNSRAEAHYNPKIIEGLTKHSTYNLGVSGTPINILKIRWQSYINRNKLPKLLIIDVGNSILGTSSSLFEKFQYLPYTSRLEYKEVAKNIDKDFCFENIIPMYKYRGYEIQVFNKISAIGDTNCRSFYNGYKPRDKPWDEENWRIFRQSILKKEKSNFRENYKNGIKELNEIVLFCNANNIEVCFVWSPQYYQTYNFLKEQRVYLDSVFKNIAKMEKFNYVNFFTDTLFYDKTNYYDKSHLNVKGSNLFSEKISDYLNDKYFNK